MAAYAYELLNESIMTDAEYDKLSSQVDTSKQTGNDLLDTFFVEHFTKDSGMWILKHPELDKVKMLYESLYKEPRTKHSSREDRQTCVLERPTVRKDG